MNVNKYSEGFERGSEWRKWDLHVHTPKSICQSYGEDNETTWNKYINDLEGLPRDFSVIGINDYLFLDGYKKVVSEKEKGKLENIDLILPVLEFRIAQFAGIEFEKTKRINLHVIFSNEVPIETIQSQFLDTLQQSYTLEDTGKKWERAITKDSVEELGKKIKSAAPEAKLSQYGSDLTEGFNNLNVDENQIFQSLGKDCFEGKYLIAIGKTEWEALKWSDSSIATKKTIINQADIVFTASESIENFHNAKGKLVAAKVNSLLLDCSDAHDFSDSVKTKDKVGNCVTWIKANPTFEGLKQIIHEPEERVFIGEEPDILSRLRNNPTKYIDSLEIRRVDSSSKGNGKWFEDVKIKFNHELIAIIGNKGSGKSAFSDVLGLLGNSKNGGRDNQNFAFLNKSRFKKPGFADNFEATITWNDGRQITMNLNDEINKNVIEQVEYLPQKYFDSLCNDLEGSGFEQKLKDITFTHLKEEEKLGKNSFEELIRYKTETVEADINILKNELDSLIKDLISLDEKTNPEFLENIKSQLASKERELGAHQKNKPPEVSNPHENDSLEQNELQKKIEMLQEKIGKQDLKIKENHNKISTLSCEIQQLKHFLYGLKTLEGQIKTYKENNKEICQKYGFDINNILNVRIVKEGITAKIEEKEEELSKIKKATGDDTFGNEVSYCSKEDIPLVTQLKQTEQSLKSLKEKLEGPNKLYDDYKNKLKDWEQRKAIIEGSGEYESEPNTIKFYKERIRYIENELHNDLNHKTDILIAKSVEIYKEKQKIIKIYETLKGRIEAVIQDKTELPSKYEIKFEAAFRLDTQFSATLLDFINKNMKGFFRGVEESKKNLNNILEQYSINREADMCGILKDILGKLKQNKTFIGSQISNLADFYKYLFALDFLKEKYELKLNDTGLECLSPGEKGTLLLIFYLLLDKNDIPLIIDEPESNLDNESVFKVLAEFIKKTKQRRQIFMVTHNPNLAIGADAEQIIHTKIDKQDQNSFTVKSGSIENPMINQSIVNILEGTQPAFEKRDSKYQRH